MPVAIPEQTAHESNTEILLRCLLDAFNGFSGGGGGAPAPSPSDGGNIAHILTGVSTKTFSANVFNSVTIMVRAGTVTLNQSLNYINNVLQAPAIPAPPIVLNEGDVITFSDLNTKLRNSIVLAGTGADTDVLILTIQ